MVHDEVMADTTAPEIQQPRTAVSAVTKLPPLPKGASVHSSLVSARAPSTHRAHRFYVNPKSPFRSITTRVRKQLDKILRTASSLDPQAPTTKLAKRSTMSVAARTHNLQRDPGNSGIGLETAREVVVLGTGRAIEKVVHVAAFFRGQPDCDVTLRTASVRAVDEITVEGDEHEGSPEQRRARMVSCLEAHIRLK